MSIFIYWIVVSNFAVFLELPYNAIPFWSFLGVTAAYCDQLYNGNNFKRHEQYHLETNESIKI